jgi:hypothetical protein
LGLYASDDGIYQASDTRLGDLLRIGPDTIDGTHMILANEDPSRALEPGDHTLWIDVSGTAVEDDGLAYDAVKVVLGVLDPGNLVVESDADPLNEDNTAAFRGIYKGADDRAVVRTGVGSTDEVTITDQLRFTSEFGSTTKEYTAPGLSTSGLGDVLVVTADGSDRITVEAAVHTVLIGGTGGDTYEFVGRPFADHDLREDPDETLLDAIADRDRISFLNFTEGPVQLDLSSTNQQTFSQTTIKLSDDVAFEDLFGTAV